VTDRRRSLFEVLEQPAEGWVVREIKRVESTDHPVLWQVWLMRERDGWSITFENESLHVAWVRSIEAAHMRDRDL
jgi:hypothetical protein